MAINLGFQTKCEVYSEPLMHALSPREGPVESFLQFHLKSTQRAVCCLPFFYLYFCFTYLHITSQIWKDTICL